MKRLFLLILPILACLSLRAQEVQDTTFIITIGPQV